MKSKWLYSILILIGLHIGLCSALWAQDKKNDIFNITPAVSFAWYPYGKVTDERSTKTEFDLNNFGMSVIMNFKLYDIVGTHLNLKIDDPAFKNLVDITGFITAPYLMLKFNYHFFSGTVTWTENTPNPISGGVSQFRNQRTNVSMLFRVDNLKWERGNNDFLNIFYDYIYESFYNWGLVGRDILGAIGVGYSRFEMPLEYRVYASKDLENPGFGLVKGELLCFAMHWDTLTWNIERSASERNNFWQYLCIYMDFLMSIPSFYISAKTDAQAIEWINNNNSNTVNGNFYDMSYLYVNAFLGLQYIWDIGINGKIGLAVGVEIFSESIKAFTDDFSVKFDSEHYGPAVRLSVRW
jgi:hypothetical protein